MASDLAKLVQMTPDGKVPLPHPPRQYHHRLGSKVIEQLLTDYQAGVPIDDLVTRYKVDQSTITKKVKLAGVRLRYPKLRPEEIDKAARLYLSGESLVAVAARFGIDASTIRRALLKAGVKMRDHHGRDRNL